MNAHPSDVVLIGRIFIGFYYRRGGEAVLVAENFTGEVRPAHFEISGLDSPTYPPRSVLIGFNESLLFIVKPFYELINLVLGKVVFLVHLFLQHIFQPEFEFYGLGEVEPGIAED